MVALTVTVQFNASTMAAINSMANSLAIIAAATPSKQLTAIEGSLATIASAVASKGSPLAAIVAAMTSEESSLAGIGAALAAIAKTIDTPPPPPPVALAIGAPIALKGKIVMANFQLENDAVVAWPILTTNAGGLVEPAPSGDVFTVVSSNPASMNAVIGTATFPPATTPAPAVLTNALVAESDPGNHGGGLTFTITDSAGLKSATSPLIDIVVDATPVALDVGTTPVVVGSQPAPTAPGP